MSSVRDELVRFARLNPTEQRVDSYSVLEQLDQRFGDSIPGLFECLRDGHPEIRHLAVQLLSIARPRSDVAVPAMIERLSDEDWLVVTTTILSLGGFGSLAVSAVPMIEEWLQSPNEFLRVQCVA